MKKITILLIILLVIIVLIFTYDSAQEKYTNATLGIRFPIVETYSVAQSTDNTVSVVVDVDTKQVIEKYSVNPSKSIQIGKLQDILNGTSIENWVKTNDNFWETNPKVIKGQNVTIQGHDGYYSTLWEDEYIGLRTVWLDVNSSIYVVEYEVMGGGLPNTSDSELNVLASYFEIYNKAKDTLLNTIELGTE